MSFKFKLPVNKIIPNTDITNGISYEIICAAPRMRPKKRIFIIRCPACGHNAEGCQSRNSNIVEQTNTDIGKLKLVCKRNRRNYHKGWCKGNNRCQFIKRYISKLSGSCLLLLTASERLLLFVIIPINRLLGWVLCGAE